MSIKIFQMFWSTYHMLHYIISGLLLSLLYFFYSSFKHTRYNTFNFFPEKTHPQNAASARHKFLSWDKKFVGKIEANLASWRKFLGQIFVDKLFIDSSVMVILFWKTVKDGIMMQCRCSPGECGEKQRQLGWIFSTI